MKKHREDVFAVVTVHLDGLDRRSAHVVKVQPLKAHFLTPKCQCREEAKVQNEREDWQNLTPHFGRHAFHPPKDNSKQA